MNEVRLCVGQFNRCNFIIPVGLWATKLVGSIENLRFTEN